MTTLMVVTSIFNFFQGMEIGIIVGGIVVVTMVGFFGYVIYLYNPSKHTCEYCNINEAFQRDGKDKFVCSTCNPHAITKKWYNTSILVGRILYPILILLFAYVFTKDEYAGKEKMAFEFRSYKVTGKYDTWEGCESIQIGIDLVLKKEPTANIEFIYPIKVSETDERIVGYVIAATKEKGQTKKSDNDRFFKEDSKTAQELNIKEMI